MKYTAMPSSTREPNSPAFLRCVRSAQTVSLLVPSGSTSISCVADMPPLVAIASRI